MADLNQVLTQTTTSGTTNQTSGQNNVGVTTQTNQQTFTPQQLQMQNQANNLMQQILTGNLHQFGPTQATYDAANAMFQQRQAPALAAIHGSGSPALNAAYQDLNLQLAGQFQQTAIPQAINAYNAAAQYAFNPTGYTNTGNQTQATTQNTNTTQNQTQRMTDVGGVLGSVFSGIGSILNS